MVITAQEFIAALGSTRDQAQFQSSICSHPQTVAVLKPTSTLRVNSTLWWFLLHCFIPGLGSIGGSGAIPNPIPCLLAPSVQHFVCLLSSNHNYFHAPAPLSAHSLPPNAASSPSHHFLGSFSLSQRHRFIELPLALHLVHPPALFGPHACREGLRQSS